MSHRTLIGSELLAEHLDDPLWVVFDCSFDLKDPEAGRRAYQAGHIPGALYAHLDRDLAGPISAASGRHPLPDPEVFAHWLGERGVSDGSQVVIYDAQWGANAVRLWWMLRWLGHDAVAVLDGGLQAWQCGNYPLTAELHPRPAAYFPVGLRSSLAASTSEVEEGVRRGTCVLIDARASERFRGEVEPIDRVAGHVPGAVNHPYPANLGSDGRFLPADQLRVRYQSLLGERPPEQTVVMCGSGVTACHNLLAMEVAGLTGARLYVGSWSAWIAEGKPATTGATPSGREGASDAPTVSARRSVLSRAPRQS